MVRKKFILRDEIMGRPITISNYSVIDLLTSIEEKCKEYNINYTVQRNTNYGYYVDEDKHRYYLLDFYGIYFTPIHVEFNTVTKKWCIRKQSEGTMYDGLKTIDVVRLILFPLIK